MNKRQKGVHQTLLQNEKQVLDDLKKNYESTLSDIRDKIERLQADPLTQSKVYQIEYQEMLERQIQAYIDILNGNNYSTINEYMQKCYEDGFIGTIYDLHGQDVNLVLPISQDKVIKSIQKSADGIKLSDRLYSNSQKLKHQIKAEITRGLSNGYTYLQIANSLSGYAESNRYQAYRIARTEGHRISQEATFEAQQAAKDKGADVVKQWSSAMDTRTRDSHMRLDQEVRELEEPFEVEGNSAMYPGGFGVAAEDINCRCVLLQRARWALSDEKLRSLSKDKQFASIGGKDYNEFKKNYKDHIASCGDFQSLSDYLQRRYNVILDKALYDLDFDAVKDAVWGIETVFDDFAGLSTYLKEISIAGNGIMTTNPYGVIRLNPEYFRNYEDLLYAASLGYFHNNAVVSSMGSHEAGHLIEAALIWRMDMSEDEKIKFWNTGSYAEHIVNTAYNQIRTSKSIEELRREISNYAADDSYSETFAEAIADYFVNGSKATELSQAIYNLLKGVF